MECWLVLCSLSCIPIQKDKGVSYENLIGGPFKF